MGVERGIVTDMSKAEVTLSVGGAKRPFPANEIQRIIYEGEPSDLTLQLAEPCPTSRG